MKKIMSLVLAVTLLVSVFGGVAVFAADASENTAYNGNPVVIVRGIDFAGLTYEDGSKALSVDEEVSSPTFAIVNDYGGNPPLYHFDMYRISSWEELYSCGFFEYIESGGIVAAEWSENIENALPDNTVYVEFETLGENKRKITIFKKGEMI